MPIMSSAEWIKDTKRFGRGRGDDLKQLDSALAKYHIDGNKREDLEALSAAFNKWAGSKASNGLDSIRNHKDAVAHLGEQIDAALLRLGRPVLPPVPSGAVLRPHRVAPSATATASTMTDDAQVTIFAAAVNALWTATNWNNKTKKQRGEAVIAAVAAVHANCGVPNVTPDVKVLPPGYGGFFDQVNWAIQLSEGLFDFPFSPGNKQRLTDVAETVYHEARHCEQWFHMARYFALGRTATDIERLWFPAAVAVEAKRRQMTADDKMNTLTKAWFKSVFGDSDREITLKALGMKRVANSTDMGDFHSRVHSSYSGGLPEEVDAWAIQLLVRAKM